MTASGDYRQQLTAIGDKAVAAVGNGAAAMEDVNLAIQGLTTSIENMEHSRVWALQELGHVAEYVFQLEAVMNETGSPDLMDAYLKAKWARQKIEDYCNRMVFAIDESKKRLEVLKHRVDTELDLAGIHLRESIDALTRYLLTL